MKSLTESRYNIFISFLTVIAIVGLDRITKIFFTNILSLGESLPIIDHFLYFTLVHNTGIAFGLFKNQGIVFIIIPAIAIGLVIFNIYFYRNHPDVSRIYIVAFSLILAGAIGNLADRIYFGYVIDFIDLRVWPVFNLADSAITVGTIILLIKCIPSFFK